MTISATANTPTRETRLPLAAVVFEPGHGELADDVLASVALDLKRRGIRLAGTVQRAATDSAGCRCDMLVIDLASGRETSISEQRGAHARGCKLDSFALAEAAGIARAALDQCPDLVVINRFGKRESEGSGLRDLIAMAIGQGTPAIVAVNRSHLDSWHQFTGGLCEELPADAAAVRDWARAVLGA